LLPLKTITFFGRQDLRCSSPPRVTANRESDGTCGAIGGRYIAAVAKMDAAVVMPLMISPVRTARW
jgi:hypothetical protein